MKNFEKFSKDYPDTAKNLMEMSKEEILEHYAREVADKDELAEFKYYYEETSRDLESIINFGIQWLKKNKPHGKHHIYIDSKTGHLVYSNIETEFIQE